MRMRNSSSAACLETHTAFKTLTLTDTAVTMEFSEEIAVLQAAFNVAAQMKAGLEHMEQQRNSEAVSIISQAVSEVVRGLRLDRSQQDQQDWEWKVTVMLVILSISDTDALEQLECSDSFAGALNGMPCASPALVYDVIKTCHLLPHFIQIVHQVDKRVGLHLVQGLVQHAMECADDRDVVTMETLAMYLLLSDGGVLSDRHQYTNELLDNVYPEKSRLRNSDILNDLNDVLVMTYRNRNIETKGKVALIQDLLQGLQDCRELLHHPCGVLLSLLNLLLDASNLRHMYLDYSYDHQSHLSSLCQKFVSTCGDKDQESMTKLMVNLHTCLKKEAIPVSSNIIIPVMLLNSLLDTINHLLITTDMFTSLKMNFCAMLDNQNIYLDVAASDIHRTLQNSIETLQSKQETLQGNLLSASALEGATESLTVLANEFCTWLNECLDLTPDERLTLTMFLVEESIGNTQEHFSWILLQGPQTDHRWITFISTHCRYIDKDGVLFLISQYQNFLVNKSGSPEFYGKLKDVLFNSFRKLPVAHKDDILRIVYNRSGDISKMFCDNGDYTRNLTTTFNRITNEKHEHGKSIRDEVAVLALQDASAVIEKLVQTAIISGGQIKSLIQVLDELPSLYEIQHWTTGASALCHYLHEHMCYKNMSKNEIDNTLQFIQHLLQKKLRSNVKVSPKELVEIIVLPYIFRDTESPNNDSVGIPVIQALQIMHLTLSVCKEDCHWLFELQLLPIVYCLCDMVDSSRERWEGQKGDEYADQMIVLELSILCLNLLTDIIRFHTDKLPVAGMQWLYQKLAEHTWSLSLQLLPLYDAFDASMLPLVLPENYPDIFYFQGRKLKCCSREDAVMMLFQFACASDASLQMALTALKPQVLDAFHCSYNKLVALLTQVLQNCMLDEVLRVFELLSHLAERGDITLPSSARTEDLPDEILKDVKSEMWILNLLHHSVLVIAQTDMESLSKLSHLTRVVILLMQKYCMTKEKLQQLDQGACVLLMLQVFSYISLQVSALPEFCEEPLSIFALNVLTMLTEPLSDESSDEPAWKSKTAKIELSINLWSLEKQAIFRKKLK